MPRKPIPGFELNRDASGDELAQQVETAINDIVGYINSSLDAKNKRLQHVQRGIADTDAVNVGQLRDAVGRGGPGRSAPTVPIPGTIISTGTVYEYGVFTLDNIVPPNPPFSIQCLTASVKETTMTAERGTLGEAVDVGETAIDITGLPSSVDTGSYLLINDPSNQSGDLTNDEIIYVVSKASSTYTVTRGRWGSVDLAHSSGLFVFPIEVRHFSQMGKSSIGLEDQALSQPKRMDMYLPARCVVACAVFGVNQSGASGLTYEFLPKYSTDIDKTPLAPGFRTCMGQAYFLPLSTATLAVASDACPVHIKVQDPASLRTVYAYVDTAPTGANLLIEAKLDANVGSYTVIETLTITAGSNTSYNASTNAPRLRRMPYTTAWAALKSLPQDAKLQFDITQVGSTVAGGKLIVVFQT